MTVVLTQNPSPFPLPSYFSSCSISFSYGHTYRGRHMLQMKAVHRQNGQCVPVRCSPLRLPTEIQRFGVYPPAETIRRYHEICLYEEYAEPYSAEMTYFLLVWSLSLFTHTRSFSHLPFGFSIMVFFWWGDCVSWVLTFWRPDCSFQLDRLAFHENEHLRSLSISLSMNEQRWFSRGWQMSLPTKKWAVLFHCVVTIIAVIVNGGSQSVTATRVLAAIGDRERRAFVWPEYAPRLLHSCHEYCYDYR